MTEDEAKTKWCPFVRVLAWGDYQPATHNRIQSDGSPAQGSGCIGSACMAWRWEKRCTNQEQLDSERHSLVKYNIRTEPNYANTEHGYCGLAGKP